MLHYFVFLFQSFLNFFYNLKARFFTINKINHNNQNLLWKYYILLFTHNLRMLFLEIPIISYLFTMIHHSLINYMDKELELVKLEVTNGKLIRNILFNNFFIEFLLDNDFYRTYINNERIFDNNEVITSKKDIILDIIIKNKDNEHSIGELLKNYADNSGYFRDNTIINILSYKGINYEDDSIIEINKLVNFRRVKHIDNVKNLLNLHTNQIFK